MPRHTTAAQSALSLYKVLKDAHPDADCALNHKSVFELLVAVVLSAQTTDLAVNKAIVGLFERYPDPVALSLAPLLEVEACLRTIGMYRQKAKNIVGLAKIIADKHQGQVPRKLDELLELPGVGRKTANVVLGVGYGIAEGVVVDTHVQRLAQRLGFTRETTPERIEEDLRRLFPKDIWIELSHVLIFHGRRYCSARAPGCETCPVTSMCPSSGEAELVGRKPKKAR